MSKIASILQALDERTIARRVALAHDEARMQYPLRSNTVPTIEAYFDLIASYYKYHYSLCVARGGAISPADARSFAKAILEREYKRRHGDIVSAFQDSLHGLNGGARQACDYLAEALKAQAVENYVRDVFDRYVAPNSWEQKVEIIRELFAHFGPIINDSVNSYQPERYARDFEPVIRGFVEALKAASSVFRRL